MKGITKLIFYVFWGGVLGVGALGFLYAKDLLGCYDRSIQLLDSIETSSLSYGWERYKVCLGKKEAIGILDACAQNAETKSFLPKKLKPQIVGILSALRHDAQPIEERKLQHDIDCAEYPSTKFDSSDE
jgi:hypothetical protein